MSPAIIGLFVFTVVAQLFAISLLPKTGGFTQPGPTVLCSIAFILSIGALARIAHSGVEVGILIPLMSAVVPFVTMMIGIYAYGESASALKITLISVSCVLIAVAAARG